MDLAQQFKRHKGVSERYLQKQYDNTKNCQEFYAGDFMSYRDIIQFEVGATRKRAMVQFNKIKPYVSAVKGFMAQNRRKAKYSARVQSQMQELYSLYANSYAEYIRENANADQIETQQDGDMLICGYGAIETALTYGIGGATRDPNGEVIMGRIEPDTVGWDPYAKSPNLLDARWVYYSKIYGLKDAIELFDANPEDFEFTSPESEGGYSFFVRGGKYDKIKEIGPEWANAEEETVKVYFYQWMEYETFYRADNPLLKLTNPAAQMLARAQLERIANETEQDDMFSLDPASPIISFGQDAMPKLKEAFGEFLEPYEFKRKVYKSAVISGNHVFTEYKNVSQQGFTVKFKTGDYDASNKIWVGMVNSMMEPALYYNKALTELMFIIGANSKGGVMYETGSIEDIKTFEANYAKTDANVEVADGAITMGRIKPKREAFQPTGLESIIQVADGSLNDVNGIDKSFLGSSENKQETGLLQRRRIRQVVSALACYFDSITLYQKEQARLLLDFMRIHAENNDGRLFRAMGVDGKEEFLQISADKFVAEYDVTIQEAPQTQEDRQEFASTLTGIADKLLSLGDPTGKAVLAISLKYLPLDPNDVLRLTELLVPQQQGIDPQYVQQLEQQLQALMSDVTQADVKEKISQMVLNLARANESAAKAMEAEAKAGSMTWKGAVEEVSNRLISR